MQRPIEIDSALGKGALLFGRMKGHEELGRLFEFEVEVLSEQDDIDFKQVIGQPMTVHLELPADGTRYFAGLVTRFGHLGTLGRYQLYRATLRPWLWQLTRKSDCRIFQSKSAVEIVKAVLREHSIKFTASLSRSYRPRDYCVQYRETDFDFVSRLMEEEGIYYFFEHEDNNQTLVLADSSIAHGPMPGYEEVPYYPQTDATNRRLRDHIDTWNASEGLESGACLLQDFDYERPAANLQVKLVSQHELANKDFELYDYPGSYGATADGEEYVRIRLEEQYARQAVSTGAGDVRGLSPGSTFKLTNMARAGEYLVVSADYQFKSDAYESGVEGGFELRSAFSVIDSQRPFRSARITPRPVVQGPQTAIVVGKGGEDIWTDDYGRIKLHFHWDRLGQANESSSCWVRVAQLWAGSGWGGLHIPRIGQEVVVEFLEGDPDRPLVTGSVYNGSNKPPYGLPGDQTQSGIKSRSSKGGNAGNFNELRFEDKMGSEEVYLQAEKDHVILVKHDEKLTVQHDRKKAISHNETTRVGANRSETVGANEMITIGANRTESVGGNESVTIAGAQAYTVAMAAAETVGAAKAVTVGGAYAETVGAARTMAVAGSLSMSSGGASSLQAGKSVSINAASTVSVAAGKELSIKSGKDMTIAAGKNLSLTVAKDAAIGVKGKRSQKIEKSDALDVGDKLMIKVKKEVVVKCGSASITVKSGGDIIIKGSKVKIN